MQSKTMSMIEAIANLVAGYLVSVILLYFIMPMYGIIITPQTSAGIVFWFSIASLLRSYIFRRIFNYIATIKINLKIK